MISSYTSLSVPNIRAYTMAPPPRTSLERIESRQLFAPARIGCFVLKLLPDLQRSRLYGSASAYFARIEQRQIVARPSSDASWLLLPDRLISGSGASCVESPVVSHSAARIGIWPQLTCSQISW